MAHSELYSSPHISPSNTGFLGPSDAPLDYETWPYNNVTTATSYDHKVNNTCAWPWDSMNLYRVTCDVFFAMPISLLGIVGNVLSAVVMSKQKRRLTTGVMLRYLAIADTLVLSASLLLLSFKQFSSCVVYWSAYMNAYKYLFRWGYPLVYLFRFCSIWLTCLLTIDRYIAVCHPLQAQRLCTMSKTYRNMIIVVVTSILFSFVRVFEYQLDNTTELGFVVTEIHQDFYYTVIYKIIFFFLFNYLLPMALLVVLNTRLLCTLRKAESSRAEMQGSMSSHSQSNNSRSVTVIVVTVVLVCIVCNICAMLSHILYSLETCFDHLKYLGSYRRILANINNLMITINSAINFVIYCLCSKNFRTIFLRTFHCHRTRTSGREAQHMTESLTGQTYIALTKTSPQNVQNDIC